MKKLIPALMLVLAVLSLTGELESACRFAGAVDVRDLLASSPHSVSIESPNNFTIYKDEML